MTRPSWMALQGMAHSFFELDKAVIHVTSPWRRKQLDTTEQLN